MAKFYGQVIGSSNTNATRRGSSDIQAVAQSYDGSVNTRLYYKGDTLMVQIRVCDGSGVYGDEIYCGPFEEYTNVLKEATNRVRK